MQARQGDIYFIPAIIPAEAEPQEGRTVIEEGEVTGHAHRLAQRGAAIIYLLGAQMYLRVLQETTVIHEDHTNNQPGDGVLQPGDYAVLRQREQDAWGHVRQVVD
jgi:hypothetical protein